MPNTTTPPVCTCWCPECWAHRDACDCPNGPTGVPSGACEVHGDLVETTGA